MATRSRPVVEIKPDVNRIRAGLLGVVRDVLKLRSANAKVADFLLRWVHRNFATEGGLVGGWAPFKDGGRRGAGAKLLQDTGALKHSFQKFYNDRDARVSTRNRYAEFHNLGTRHLPRRPLLPITTTGFGSASSSVLPEVMAIYNAHAKSITGKRLW